MPCLVAAVETPVVHAFVYGLTQSGGVCFADQREKERSQRLQEAKTKAASHATETTARQKATSADGSAVSTVTKTQRLVQSSKELLFCHSLEGFSSLLLFNGTDRAPSLFPSLWLWPHPWQARLPTALQGTLRLYISLSLSLSGRFVASGPLFSFG